MTGKSNPASSLSSSLASQHIVEGGSTPSPPNAALLGATTAFGRPRPAAAAPNNTYVGVDGALRAATRATPSPNHGLRRSPVSAGTADSPFGSAQSAKSMRNDWGQKVSPPNLSKMPSLGLPPPRKHSKSPSLQAASLAAARASPATKSRTSPKHYRAQTKTFQRPGVAPKPRRLSEHRSRRGAWEEEQRKITDSTSIAPTTSLVDLFEHKTHTSEPSNRRPGPIIVKPSSDLAIKSPKPIRSSGGSIASMFRMELEEPSDKSNTERRDLIRSMPPVSQEYLIDERPISTLSNASSFEDAYAPDTSTENKKRDSKGPGTALQESVMSLNLPPQRPQSSPLPLQHPATEPVKIPQQPSRNAKSPSNAFSLYLQQSLQSTQSDQGGRSITAQYHQLYPRKMTPSMTGDQLADAMVAGSLASSRAPSPRKMDPLPPSNKRLKQYMLTFSRTPSPAKTGMLHTLRKVESDSSESEEDYHPYGKHKKKKHNIVRKHPNKHHEGDRKRWREAVTQRERKRYEGVWAANKGLNCSLSYEELEILERDPHSERTLEIKKGVSEQISNIAARELWSRSRLADTTLETVWDLVDNGLVGRLNKEEFVVGTWLIDQRLKGRKLPVKVSESVWASVRGLQGIKIRKPIK